MGISLQPVNSGEVLVNELKAKKERANIDMLIAIACNKPTAEMLEKLRPYGIYLTGFLTYNDVTSIIERSVLPKPS